MNFKEFLTEASNAKGLSSDFYKKIKVGFVLQNAFGQEKEVMSVSGDGKTIEVTNIGTSTKSKYVWDKLGQYINMELPLNDRWSYALDRYVPNNASRASLRESILNEAAVRKPYFGTPTDKSGLGGSAAKASYAVQVNGLPDGNSFPEMSWGRTLDSIKYVNEWKKTAKTAWVGAKGKPTMSSVKAWVKDNNPTEFYAKWTADSGMYKDDSVEIFYKK